MKRSLPMLVERTLADVKALQVQGGQEFEERQRHDGVQLSCHKGCSNCCSHPFLVSIAEGLLLYRWLAEHGRWTPSLRARVAETRDKTLGLSFNVWLMVNIPCPLLEDWQCSAYEARPLHCRTTASSGDPVACHPHELNDDTELLSNIGTVVDFTQHVQGLLRRIGVGGPLMPISEALLLGEQIDTGKLDIEGTFAQHSKDFFRA